MGRARPAEHPALVTLGRVAVPVALVGLWWLASRWYGSEALFPGPLPTLRAGLGVLRDGSLLRDVLVSSLRILAGFAIGSALGFLLGLAMGSVPVIRQALDPYLNFFRFVSGIAWVGVATLWLGLGEASKVALIAYVTVFAVALNTLAGYERIPRNRIRAARCLGAGRGMVFLRVAVPSTLHFALQGARLAMTASFLTVVAAEMVAARSGVGYLIYSARAFFTTDVMFVGIFTLGVMGVVADRLFWLLRSTVFRRYGSPS